VYIKIESIITLWAILKDHHLKCIVISNKFQMRESVGFTANRKNLEIRYDGKHEKLLFITLLNAILQNCYLATLFLI
jgi:hypothetical protein